jgi:hypothetical protein
MPNDQANGASNNASEMLASLVSAVRSINRGKAHEIHVGGDEEPCYWQRKEWIDWVLGICNETPAAASPAAPIEQPRDVAAGGEGVTDRQIKDLFLAHGFKEKPQADGAYNLNPYVFEAARALLAMGSSRLQTEVERLKVAKTRHEETVRHMANERDTHQSDLTKAREVIGSLAKGFNTLEQESGKYRINMSFASRDDAWSAYTALSQFNASAIQSAPAAKADPAIPNGYCIMPVRLTAENGAKSLLLGEFKLAVEQECSECAGLDEPSEACNICDGEVSYTQNHTISWDQIKFIYSKAVGGLSIKSPPAARGEQS